MKVMLYLGGWVCCCHIFDDLGGINPEQVVHVTTRPISFSQREIVISLNGVNIFTYAYPTPRRPFESSIDTSCDIDDEAEVGMVDEDDPEFDMEELEPVILEEEEEEDLEDEGDDYDEDGDKHLDEDPGDGDNEGADDDNVDFFYKDGDNCIDFLIFFFIRMNT